MSRTRLLLAWARWWVPESTWRAQRRKKTPPNMTSATPPMIATRSASCGDIGARFSVSRYISGASDRGRRHATLRSARARPDSREEASPVDLEAAQADRAGRGGLLAALAHAVQRIDREHRAQHAPDEGEERQRE